MLKFIKKNSTIIIICLIFLIMGIIAVNNYLDENKITSNSYAKVKYNECTEIYDKDYCDNNINTFKIPKRDTMSTLNYIVSIHFDIIQMVAPLLIIIVSSIIFHRYFRNGYLKNSITRIGYEKSLKKIYFSTLKCSLILPAFMLIMFIISYIISGNFDYQIGLNLYGFIGYSIEASKNWPIFIIIYILNFALNSIFWINISIWNLRHNKNLLVSIIVTYIEFFLAAIILDIIGTSFFLKTKYIGYFSLFNLWTFSDLPWTGILFESIIFIVLTSVMVYKAYYNKEKTMEEI